MRILIALGVAALVIAGCSQAEADRSGEGAAAVIEQARDGGTDDAAVGICAATFGDRLTPGFGRIDGTLVAIVRPVVDEHCAQPNRDHVIVQVQMNGAVYRMVVNVQSDRDGGDTRVRMGAIEAPLPAPAWEEGWHTGLALDYATDLSTHSTDDRFKPLEMAPLVSEIVSQLKIGEKVSVYAINGQGRPESAHLIHRNRFGSSTDGAIVVGAATNSPKFLMFHFDGQSF